MDICSTDPVTIATVIIAVATVVNVFVALFQWMAARSSAETAKRIFEAGNRPYVGVESIVCVKDEAKQYLNIFAIIRNFGTATAENCDFGWRLYVDGNLLSGTEIPANPTFLFPTLAHHLRAVLYKSYPRISNGSSILEIVVRFSYKWQPDKSHIYVEKYRYEHSQNAFLGLGVAPRDSQA